MIQRRKKVDVDRVNHVGNQYMLKMFWSAFRNASVLIDACEIMPVTRYLSLCHQTWLYHVPRSTNESRVRIGWLHIANTDVYDIEYILGGLQSSNVMLRVVTREDQSIKSTYAAYPRFHNTDIFGDMHTQHFLPFTTHYNHSRSFIWLAIGTGVRGFLSTDIPYSFQ